MDALLDIRNLKVSFQGESGEVDVLNNTSLSLLNKESLGSVGESGSGKPILIKSILKPGILSFSKTFSIFNY